MEYVVSDGTQVVKNPLKVPLIKLSRIVGNGIHVTVNSSSHVGEVKLRGGRISFPHIIGRVLFERALDAVFEAFQNLEWITVRTNEKGTIFIVENDDVSQYINSISAPDVQEGGPLRPVSA